MNDLKAKFIEKCKKPTIRIVILIFLIGIISVAYLFINRIKVDYKTLPNTFSIYDGEDVKLEVKYNFNGKITYDVSNFTSGEVNAGNSYILQKKNMWKWVSIKTNAPIFYTLENHIILSKESKGFSSDLVRLYGNLPIGKYRVVKDVDMNGREVYIAGEFRIVFPSLRQKITKKEAAQIVQTQVHIEDFDNIITKKVTYNGKRVYKVIFQTKYGEWVDSEVWYVDKNGLIVGNE